MRLITFSVTNFRSIAKTERIKLDQVTSLVGPNNEGKSNLLQALVLGIEELINKGYSHRSPRNFGKYRTRMYDWERDFPRQYVESMGKKTIMSFEFSLGKDLEEFRELTKSRVNDLLRVSLTFPKQGRPKFKVLKQKAGPKLTELGERIGEFIAQKIDILYVPAIRESETAHRIVQQMLSAEWYKAEAQDTEYQKASRELAKHQQRVISSIENSLNNNIGQYMVNAQISLDLDTQELPSDWRQKKLSDWIARDYNVFVDDGVKTNLNMKGHGVQSLVVLAMMQQYANATAPAESLVLAIEEPEAHLDPKAIRTLRNQLEGMSRSTQVVLSTHSSYFVDRNNLQSNIIVSRGKVRSADTRRALRETLGISVEDNLYDAEVVLIVEGLSDKKILKSILSHENQTLKRAFAQGKLLIRPFSHTGLDFELSRVIREVSKLHVFVDHDNSGQSQVSAAIEKGLLNSEDIHYASLASMNESEIEDLICLEKYASLFREKFNVDMSLRIKKDFRGGKWSVRMPHIVRASGQSWGENKGEINKYKKELASAISESPEFAIRPEAQHSLGLLSKCLEDKLRG